LFFAGTAVLLALAIGQAFLKSFEAENFPNKTFRRATP
jgi:hypothetical protein